MFLWALILCHLFRYGAQGLFKFGLNEVFKDVYTTLIGPENLQATWAKMGMWAAASGSAEFFADIALCPFEMTKVKMQVSLPGPKGEVTFPRKLMPALAKMSELKAETKFPFGSLGPLWGRQIPYTMIKFVGFYLTADYVYAQIEQRTGQKKSDLSEATQLSITFASGYWAGIFCAVATQPMDNLVSMKGNPINRDKTFGQMAKDMGTKNLFLKGLGTRVLMIGTLTGLQVRDMSMATFYILLSFLCLVAFLLASFHFVVLFLLASYFGGSKKGSKKEVQGYITYTKPKIILIVHRLH